MKIFFLSLGEIGISLILVIMPAAVLFSEYIYLNNTLYLTVGATFACVLLLTHAYYGLRNKNNSKMLPKFIDYVYLLVAAAGIIPTSLDYTNKIYIEDIKNSVKSGQIYGELLESFRDAKSIVKESCKLSIKNPPAPAKLTDPGHDCPTSIIRVDDVEKSLEAFDENVSVGELRMMFTRLDDIFSLTDYDAWDKRRNKIDDYINKLENKKPKNVDFDDWRVFGLFLIAAALSLRVTKVSIEVFGWHA